MKNLYSYPFERNRYFYGKLLNVADFDAEQRYFNDKRRFLNSFLFNSGIICGLNVYSVDDTSVMIESGALLDHAGREVVVPESVIRKLSSVDGFDASKTNTLYLCIRYEEMFSDPVHSVAQSSADAQMNGPEYNRLKEAYHLYILDEDAKPSVHQPMDKFIHTRVLYRDANVTITQRVPVAVPMDRSFSCVVEIVRHHVAQPLSFEYVVETPYFVTEEGGHRFKVSFDSALAGNSPRHTLCYALKPSGNVKTEALLSIDTGSFKLSSANQPGELQNAAPCNISVSEEALTELVLRKYFSTPMDVSVAERMDDALCLAEIKIFRSGTAYIIESVKAIPFDQYIVNPELLMLLSKMNSYLPVTPNKEKESAGQASASLPAGLALASHQAQEEGYASGFVEIPLGLNPKAKQKFYSEEIMHGLGKGDVSVVLGIETIGNASEENFTVYGQTDIFSDRAEGRNLPVFQSAALVYKERGTFVVGLKLAENTTLMSVKMRWYAFKEKSAADLVAPRADQALFIQPDTATVVPRGTLYFKAIFYNMDEMPCKWLVVEADGGNIGLDGVYTAPAKEGVYEICAACIAKPELKASAFVVVKEKGAS